MTSKQVFEQLLREKQTWLIIQAENPDADSLGSALALESILIDLDKQVTLYCPVNIPRYLHYLPGWDRVSSDFNYQAEAAIIVDTTSEVLLSKILDVSAKHDWLTNHPSVTIDHHIETQPSLPFNSHLILEPAIASAAIIYQLAHEKKWPLSSLSAQLLLAGIMGDTLGLTTANADADAYRLVAELISAGANVHQLETARQALNKKSAAILNYKAELIKRIEYHLDGRLASILIPFEEIQTYSDQYNPSMLVLDEMRLVEQVEVAVAFKTYPDGKITAKIRSNCPIASQIAGYFGGGGHEYAAGFRVYEQLETIQNELQKITAELLDMSTQNSNSNQ